MAEHKKRNYFIRRKEALTMEEVIEEYIKSAKLASGLNTQRVFAAWDECSGAGPFTLKRYFRSGTLYITLNSSVIRNQLSFQKEALIEKMNATLSGDKLFTAVPTGSRLCTSYFLCSSAYRPGARDWPPSAAHRWCRVRWRNPPGWERDS